MIKFFVLSTVIMSVVATYFWNNPYQGKPGTTFITSVATIKLAVAKASLGKQQARKTKNVLGTADGGI